MAQSAFDGQLGKRIASHLRGRREVQNNKHDKTMNHKMKKRMGCISPPWKERFKTMKTVPVNIDLKKVT